MEVGAKFCEECAAPLTRRCSGSRDESDSISCAGIGSEQPFYGLVFEGELALNRDQPEDLYLIGSRRRTNFSNRRLTVDFGQSPTEVSG